MIQESQEIVVAGCLLHRLVLHPESSVPVRAVAIFYHGQGDYAERYNEVMSPFTQAGIRVVLTELPGHGRSEGKRGHCGDVAMLDAVMASNDEWRQQQGTLPHGVMGHSMGALLAARHLLLAGRGQLPCPEFAWLSSPLLRPSRGKSFLWLGLVRFLSLLTPSITVSTGVSSGMCRRASVQDVADEVDEAENTEKRPEPRLWHDRISLGWGAALLAMEDEVAEGLQDFPENTSLLVTQGADDPVCPALLARDYFPRISCRDKTYAELPGLLHEPFRGEGSDAFYEALDHWLARQAG